MTDQKLFNGELKTTIEENERLAFREANAGTAGSRNILWSAFKTLLSNFFVDKSNNQTINGVKTFNSSPLVPDPSSDLEAVNFRTLNAQTTAPSAISLAPQTERPAYQEGRFYNYDINKSYEFYTEVTGLEPFRLGRTLRSRVLNNTGVTIVKGTLCKIVGISGTSPIVEPADNSKTVDVKLIVGMAMHDISDSTHGYLAVFDTVIGVPTSGMTVNDLIYADPENIGQFTNIEPQPPYASYPIGFVSIVDAVNGVVGIRVGGFTGSDTSINSKGILNGIVTQSPQIDIVSDGITITATVTNEEHPGSDLPFLINDIRYLLTTGQNVTVPPGASSTEKQQSIIYIYLNSGVPTLAISTTEPTVPYAKLGEIIVFDAARTQTDGVFGYRRTNNSIDKKGDAQEGSIGLIEDILSAIREKLGSNWFSGQDGTPTVNNTTIQLSLTAGIARQFRQTSVPLFDGTKYLIYNNTSNSVVYSNSINLTDITADANGNTLLANNKFYTIRIYYQLNSNGIGNNVIATRPLGSYTTANEAIQDPLNYTVNVNDTDVEEIIYPLYDIVISRTGAGGATISLVQLTDLRSKLPSRVGGGGASGGAGADDKVRISANDTTNDYLNPKITVGDEFTKEIANPAANESLLLKFKGWIYNSGRTFKAILDAVNLTADRTFTFPDVSGLFAVFGMTNAFKFNGQVNGGDATLTFSATPTFNLNNGNIQRMSVEGNATLSLSNKVNGGTYQLELVIDATGGYTITPDASFGTITDNSLTNIASAVANATYIYTILVGATGTTYYTIESIGG